MIKEYINDNKDRFLSELFELLKIESVSADSKFKEEVDKAANWLVDEFNKLELDNVEKIQTKGHPIVFAEKILDKTFPTILVYGHYDVQPVDPIELWDFNPFEPRLIDKDGKKVIHGRGSSDDKGQILTFFGQHARIITA